MSIFKKTVKLPDGGILTEHYKQIGYHDVLMKARDAGKPEPDIPPLDDVTVKNVSKLYIDLFEKITGTPF